MIKSYNNGLNSAIPSTPYFLLVGSLAVGGGGGPLLSSSSRYDIRMSALSSLSGSMMWYLLSLQSTSSISSMWFPSLSLIIWRLLCVISLVSINNCLYWALAWWTLSRNWKEKHSKLIFTFEQSYPTTKLLLTLLVWAAELAVPRVITDVFLDVLKNCIKGDIFLFLK